MIQGYLEINNIATVVFVRDLYMIYPPEEVYDLGLRHQSIYFFYVNKPFFVLVQMVLLYKTNGI